MACAPARSRRRSNRPACRSTLRRASPRCPPCRPPPNQPPVWLHRRHSTRNRFHCRRRASPRSPLRHRLRFHPAFLNRPYHHRRRHVHRRSHQRCHRRCRFPPRARHLDPPPGRVREHRDRSTPAGRSREILPPQRRRRRRFRLLGPRERHRRRRAHRALRPQRLARLRRGHPSSVHLAWCLLCSSLLCSSLLEWRRPRSRMPRRPSRLRPHRSRRPSPWSVRQVVCPDHRPLTHRPREVPNSLPDSTRHSNQLIPRRPVPRRPVPRRPVPQHPVLRRKTFLRSMRLPARSHQLARVRLTDWRRHAGPPVPNAVNLSGTPTTLPRPGSRRRPRGLSSRPRSPAASSGSRRVDLLRHRAPAPDLPRCQTSPALARDRPFRHCRRRRPTAHPRGARSTHSRRHRRASRRSLRHFRDAARAAAHRSTTRSLWNRGRRSGHECNRNRQRTRMSPEAIEPT